MSMRAAPQQEIDAIIEAHGGDARAAVRELLADADSRREKHATIGGPCSTAMRASNGIATAHSQ